ncbi:MAG: hypothetical protein ACFCUR_06640 [Rhodomicrobiaceae bacterium]
MEKKKCFVIAPIGEEGSDIRKRSDQILNHILRPVANEHNFDVTRADEITEPGIITTQIIERIVHDPLVIADLTGRNPNVYYELAVRHASRNPVIQLIEKGETLPFDVAGTRTIVVDHKDLDSVASAKNLLHQYIVGILESKNGGSDSPISLSIDIKALRDSHDPQRASIADLVERMTSVHGTVLSIQDGLETKLSRRLDRVLKLVSALNFEEETETSSEAVSNLSDKVESLRIQLQRAVGGILEDVKAEHAQLANNIQTVFDEQSETASDVVAAHFSRIVDTLTDNTETRKRTLGDLVEAFMNGMKSMGLYQNINVTETTQESAETIKLRINESIKNVFKDIDDIEEMIIALPNPGGN